ncbi:MAG: hypothetical protein JWM74_6211 [Myxococcaceae bacterium]|jgi:hypothetical protein|nr:hypothetical protein [Myxococcaceae bacterium]
MASNKEAKLPKTTVPLSRHEMAVLREKSRQPKDMKGLPTVTMPPAELESSEQPTLPPKANEHPSGMRPATDTKITTVEIMTPNPRRRDPRSEE